MNWLLIIVIVFFAWNLVWGYRRGLLLVVYSLTAWLAALMFVTWATPFVSGYIINYTDLDEHIKEQTMETLHEIVLTDSGSSSKEQGASGALKPKSVQQLGIPLPEVLTEYLAEGDDVADQFLESSGIYEQIAGQISHMVVKGISFLTVLLITMVLLKVVEKTLDLVSKIEVVSEINKAAGLIAGGIKGMILIWLAFAGIAALAATESGMALSSCIYENPLLTWIYENNLVLSVIMLFL